MQEQRGSCHLQHHVGHDVDVAHDDAVGELGAVVDAAALTNHALLQVFRVMLVLIHHSGRHVPLGAAVLAAAAAARVRPRRGVGASEGASSVAPV